MGQHRRTWHSHASERASGNRTRSNGRNRLYSLFVGACAALMFLAILGPDKIPAAAQGLLSASRNLGRDHAAPVGAYYSGCDDARAAGVAPIYSDEPGYREEMDGDGDGVACEPYR